MSDDRKGLRRDPTWSAKAVGAFVPKATAKAFEKHGFHTAEIIMNWAAIVGPELAAFTAPRRIRWPKSPDGTPLPAQARAQKTALEIWVSGGRAHELPYLKAPIIARINTYFGYRAIADILPVDGPTKKAKPAAPRRDVTAAEVAAVKAEVKLTGNDALSEALARLGANVKRKAKAG